PEGPHSRRECEADPEPLIGGDDMPQSRVLLSFLAVLLMAACAPRPSTSGEAAAPPVAPTAPKRIGVGVQSDFNQLATRLVRSGTASRPGVAEVEQLVNAGLTQTDNTGALQGVLAEAVPSTANGLWTVLPDGRMETRWRIREGVVWQDGTPFTADDLVFTATVGQDAEVPLLRNPSLALAARAYAADPRTFVVAWKQPFIDADSLFVANGTLQHPPLPRHLLEAAYLENKTTLDALPYWSTDF